MNPIKILPKGVILRNLHELLSSKTDAAKSAVNHCEVSKTDAAKNVVNLCEVSSKTEAAKSRPSSKSKTDAAKSVAKQSLDLDLLASCQCKDRNWKDFPQLQAILPSGYNYSVCQFSLESNEGDGCWFYCELRLDIYLVDDLLRWKEEFEAVSYSTYRCLRTFPRVGQKVEFRRDFVCQHSKFNKTRGSKKDTNCKAFLRLVLKKILRRSRGRDGHLPHQPCVIKINWRHNHPIQSLTSLRYRDVSDETRDELLALFRLGHNPPKALAALRSKVQQQSGGGEEILKDRRFVPELGFVSRLYAAQFKRLWLSTESDEAPPESTSEQEKLVHCSEPAAKRRRTEAHSQVPLKRKRTAVAQTQPLQPNKHVTPAPVEPPGQLVNITPEQTLSSSEKVFACIRLAADQQVLVPLNQKITVVQAQPTSGQKLSVSSMQPPIQEKELLPGTKQKVDVAQKQVPPAETGEEAVTTVSEQVHLPQGKASPHAQIPSHQHNLQEAAQNQQIMVSQIELPSGEKVEVFEVLEQSPSDQLPPAVKVEPPSDGEVASVTQTEAASAASDLEKALAEILMPAEQERSVSHESISEHGDEDKSPTAVGMPQEGTSAQVVASLQKTTHVQEAMSAPDAMLVEKISCIQEALSAQDVASVQEVTSTDTVPTNTFETDTQKCVESLNTVCERLKQIVSHKPGVFLEPLTVFLSTLKAIKTESALVKALNSFGKVSPVVSGPKPKWRGGYTNAVDHAASGSKPRWLGGYTNNAVDDAAVAAVRRSRKLVQRKKSADRAFPFS